jgi:hypothetical protein
VERPASWTQIGRFVFDYSREPTFAKSVWKLRQKEFIKACFNDSNDENEPASRALTWRLRGTTPNIKSARNLGAAVGNGQLANIFSASLGVGPYDQIE